MRDGTGTTTYAYDAASRTTGKTDPGALSQANACDGDVLKTSMGVRTKPRPSDRIPDALKLPADLYCGGSS